MTPTTGLALPNSLPDLGSAAALLALAQGETERAVELYALACRYPYVANSQWFHDVIGRDVAKWEKVLPADVVAAARERGRERD